jgi:hypothetical protein
MLTTKVLQTELKTNWLRPRDAVPILGLSVARINMLILERRIAVLKTPLGQLIHVKEVERFLHEHKPHTRRRMQTR